MKWERAEPAAGMLPSRGISKVENKNIKAYFATIILNQHEEIQYSVNGSNRGFHKTKPRLTRYCDVNPIRRAVSLDTWSIIQLKLLHTSVYTH